MELDLEAKLLLGTQILIESFCENEDRITSKSYLSSKITIGTEIWRV